MTILQTLHPARLSLLVPRYALQAPRLPDGHPLLEHGEHAAVLPNHPKNHGDDK